MDNGTFHSDDDWYFCNDSHQFPNFIKVVNDCNWRVSDLGNSTKTMKTLDAFKIVQMFITCVTLFGDVVALAVYSNLVRNNMDIHMHGYLLILAVYETLHQVFFVVKTGYTVKLRTDYLLEYGIDIAEVNEQWPYIATLYLFEIIQVLTFVMYASRNYWVMIIVCNRCLALKCYENSPRGQQHFSRERFKLPLLIALLNILFWFCLIFYIQLTSTELMAAVCEKNKTLNLHASSNTDSMSETIIPRKGSDAHIQVHLQKLNCFHPKIEPLLKIAYFSLVVYVPFLVIAFGCLGTWLQVRQHRYSGRYARVRNLLIVITTSYAISECPNFVRGMVSDIGMLISEPSHGYGIISDITKKNISDKIQEITELFSGLNSIAILAFYLFSDPTFLSYTRRLFCRNVDQRRSSISYRETWGPTEHSICFKSCHSSKDNEEEEHGAQENQEMKVLLQNGETKTNTEGKTLETTAGETAL